MKPKIIFATSNTKKLREVREIIGDMYEVLSLDDIGFAEEIPEPYDTIRENSIHKAQFFFEKTQLPCIAEDSGLEVEALQQRPGAYSARYAGEERDDVKNYMKVLEELNTSSNRNARFVAVISYKTADGLVEFEGHMNGRIALFPRGENGFGYDPIFIPNGYDKTNAELTSEEKNAISHRRKALDKMTAYFSSLQK